MAEAKAPPIDKRRNILDAAITVFARQGFHSTRVSDIADEAGVAYGLVYHYFNSKDEVLNELFSERWSLLLAAIEEADASSESPRSKLAAVAGFIVDSYGHSSIVDPWGRVLAGAETGAPQIVAADLDLSAQDEVRESLPSLANRRPESYVWPQLLEMHA